MEKEFIDWLCSREKEFPNENPVKGESKNIVELGIGDDAAVLFANDRIVVATDAIAEGTHFACDESLARIGRKALAVNLSDLAAMGASPIAATIALQMPARFELAQVKELYLGIEQLAQQFCVAIVGGDTNRWDGGIVVSVTAIGVPFGKKAGKLWRISGAAAGDAVLVSGEFGGSILGKHLDFEPRVALAEYLVDHYAISAATDASDSLSADLASIAAQSKLGFEMELGSVPLSDASKELAKTSGKTALEHGLSDGEDFELIICAPESEALKMLDDKSMPTKLTRIGKMTAECDFIAIDAAGNRSPLTIQGYQH